MDRFRNARENFLRRQRQNDEADLERQQTVEQEDDAQSAPDLAAQQLREMSERRSSATTFLSRFSDLRHPAFRSRRNTNVLEYPAPRPISSHYSFHDVESPKSPNFQLGIPPMPSTRLHLPNLARTWTQGSNGPPSRPGTSHSHGTNWPSLSQSGAESVVQPVPAIPAEHIQGQSRGSRRRFEGTEPAEMHLADMASDGRRRHRHRRHGSGSGSSSEHGPERRKRRHHRGRDGRRAARHRPPPKHFLFCFPWIKSRHIRKYILRAFVSGLFLAILLSVYLALTITKNVTKNEITVLLILVILFATIFFCHSLVRLCIHIVRPPQERGDQESNLPSHAYTHGGYAVPSQPIRVHLARDEEAAGVESETSSNGLKPPAYGLWRESVRVDPDRIYWQRNTDAASSSDEEEERPVTSTRRPPSYISEDGVSYVVEAQPRSIAPTTPTPSAAPFTPSPMTTPSLSVALPTTPLPAQGSTTPFALPTTPLPTHPAYI